MAFETDLGYLPNSTSSLSLQSHLYDRRSPIPSSSTHVPHQITRTMSEALSNGTPALDGLPHPATSKTAISSGLEENPVQRGKDLWSTQRTDEVDGSNGPTFAQRLKADVDLDLCYWSLIACCLVTGMLDSVSFSAAFVWIGFQTGNSVQLSLALARLFEGDPATRDDSFRIADQLALCSVLTFVAGAFIGRIGNYLGPKSRIWLISASLVQALFTMAAALTIWKNEQPSITDSRNDIAWTGTLAFVCIGFMSASVGLQGIMCKRLGTQFTTTVVLTTTWCELMVEPELFRLKWNIARDHKILGIFFVFIGGFFGRSVLARTGSAGALGVITGIRLLIALSWWFIPSKKVKL